MLAAASRTIPDRTSPVSGVRDLPESASAFFGAAALTWQQPQVQFWGQVSVHEEPLLGDGKKSR